MWIGWFERVCLSPSKSWMRNATRNFSSNFPAVLNPVMMLVGVVVVGVVMEV